MGEYISDDARRELGNYDFRQIAEAMEIVDHTGLVHLSLGVHVDHVKHAESANPDEVRDTDDAYWLASNDEYREAMDDLADDFIRAILAVIKMRASKRKADAIHDQLRRDIHALADAREELSMSDTLSIADFLPDEPQE